MVASVATLCVPSKRPFLLAIVNLAPPPTLRMSNMVRYFHEEPLWIQLHWFASVHPQIKTMWL